MLFLLNIIMFQAQNLVENLTHGYDSTTHCSTKDVCFFKS